MEVRHFIKAHCRGVLLAELHVFFIRPWCSKAGSLGVEPTVSERRSLMAALAYGRLIYPPLDHLNVLAGPAFDYLIFDPEEGFGSMMPKPLALEFVAVVGRASWGVGVGAFDGLSEPNTNPDVEACHEIKNSSLLAALRGRKLRQCLTRRARPSADPAATAESPATGRSVLRAVLPPLTVVVAARWAGPSTRRESSARG